VHRRRLLARAALRIALARCLGCAPAALRFATDASGKPRLDRPGPQFSVSSSSDWSLIAVTSPGPVGIDLEGVVALAELEAIVARRFTPAQAQEILNRAASGAWRPSIAAGRESKPSSRRPASDSPPGWARR
jgi:phosphopantetheinyl transferase